MSTHAATLINAVPGIERMRYLELGSAGGNTLSRVRAAWRCGVDCGCPRPPGADEFFAGTSDEFFAARDDRWDVVFVDACHEVAHVQRDLRNALARATWGVFLHDLWPPSEGHVAPNWCGDGYRLLRSLVDTRAPLATLNVDYGLTCVRPFKPGPLDGPPPELTLAQFEADMADAGYSRLPVDEMLTWIRR